MKKIYKTELAVAFVFAIILIVGYQYFLYQENLGRSKTAEVFVVTDAITGNAIPKEEIARIKARQQEEKRSFSVSGTVISKAKGIITLKRDEGGSISLKLFSGGQVIKMENETERSIKMEDIQIGEMVSVIFPKGITEREIAESEILTVRNISVYTPYSNKETER